MIRVLFASSEATPFAQTGGLGEVCGSLPHALARAGCDVRLVLPAYGAILRRFPALPEHARLRIAGYPGTCRVLALELAPGLSLWLVDAPALFDRDGGPYADSHGRDWHDNPHRYACFSRAVAQLALDPTWRPDVVHCHDWPTGLVPALLAEVPDRPATVFTIHNLAFAGLCDRDTFDHLGLPPAWWDWQQLEFHGQCAFLKGGLVFADRLTTVSPTYAQEILTPKFGHGLDGLLRHRAHALTGILNGIDTEAWNPHSDQHIAARFDGTDLDARLANKRALQQAFGLEPAAGHLLLGVVSRLTDQKGIDLLVDALRDLGAEDVQCVVLGSGEPRLERSLRELAIERPAHVAVRFGYDLELSHRLFAGVDAFVMPSRFEPCGLSQLYSQRYGAVPIVRRTGGLADSVLDAAHPQGTGFVLEEASSGALVAAIRRAHACWREVEPWRALQHRGMAADFSWARSALAYHALYAALRP